MNSSLVQPVLALLGYPIVGNPSQYVVEQALLHHQLDCRYLSFDVPPEKLGDAIRGCRRWVSGVGIARRRIKRRPWTPPPPYTYRRVCGCSELHLSRRRVPGRREYGRQGFLEALRRRLDPAGKRIVLLGTNYTPGQSRSSWRRPGRPRSRWSPKTRNRAVCWSNCL